MASVFLLQGIIFLVVFGKIQCLRLGWDPLAGVILEFQALFLCAHYAFFGAKDLILVEPGAEAAVGAGLRDALSKEHGMSSCFCLMP